MFPDSYFTQPKMQPQEATKPVEATKAVEPVVKTEDTKPVAKKTRNYGEWYDHVNKYKAEHPDVSHKDAVKEAKATYTKAPRKKRDTSGHKPNAWMKHVADWVDKNPGWRQKYTYKEVLQLCKKTYKKKE